MRVKYNLALVVIFIASPAFADMDLKTMQTAQGLAGIIANADKCGYEIDETALENYYVSKRLNSPDVLSFITNTIDVSKFGDEPTKSKCTMFRTTGKSIGIVKG